MTRREEQSKRRTFLRHVPRTRVVVGFVCLLLVPGEVLAEISARLFSKEGVVQARKGETGAWRDLQIDEELQNDDTIRTGKESRAALRLNDGVMVRLNQNSILEFAALKPRDGLHLQGGKAYFLSREASDFPTIKTRHVSASVRGTEFTVSTDEREDTISVLNGSVEASNDHGRVSLSDGEEAVAGANQAPVKRLMADPAGAVQWALHYPVPLDDGDLPEARQGNLKRVFEALRDGDSRGASEILDQNAASATPAEWLVRSGIYLSRGQVDEARAIHQRVEPQISTGPLNEALRSQQAIIALVTNERQVAEEIYEKHLVDKTGSTAVLAKSYVLQSRFDLDEANRLIEEAIAVNPENPHLLARHAELLFSYGKLEEALEEAEKSLERFPSNSYALSVKGFALLGMDRVEEARAAFDAARKLGSSMGLPFLGLGLAEMRDGNVEESRQLIQQAANLEPLTALYRSYLGKALFEEEKETTSGEEYDRAIALDPEDPTPYLYRSYLRVSQNRPVEALRDVEESIARNDNRAVYRSRLMLDQDEGVRSSSLAQVYETLGFDELARTEAIKSITRDYSNYSAHLLLARSYDGPTDLIQSSISEFLIARLLSPINFNLVRPSQGGTVGAGEYSTLFDRDQDRVSLDFEGRTRDRSVEPGFTVSGTHENFGYAVSHVTEHADGYRDNDRTVEHNSYASLQYQPTHDDTILLDALTTFFEIGDTDIGYNPNVNDPDSELELDDYILRLGFNHRFGPGNQLIGQVLGSDSDFKTKEPNSIRDVFAVPVLDGEIVDEPIEVNLPTSQRTRYRSEGVRADLQHIFDSTYVSNIAGVAFQEAERNLDETGTVTEEFIVSELSSSAENGEGSRRAYTYTTFHVAPWLDLQGGATYAHLKATAAPLLAPATSDTETFTEWSPKAGFLLTPATGTTIRGAYFETIGNSAFRELEVIEPTIVGGFNQNYFDIFPASRSRSLAIGVDQKFTTGTYVGAELIERHDVRNFRRNFDVLNFNPETLEPTGSLIVAGDNPRNHFDRDGMKAYAYQTLGDNFALTSDFRFFRELDTATDVLIRSQTARFGLNYFHASGLLAFVSSAWREQDLGGFESEVIPNGTEDFWLLDAGVGYRFPYRRGLVKLFVSNILDRDFRYLTPDYEDRILPGIGAGIQLTYNFEP